MSCNKSVYAPFPDECPHLKVVDYCVEEKCMHHKYSLHFFLESENAPIVSIIMPYYMGHATVGKAIQSVLDQDYPNWELIIVNDGSSDFSAKMLQVELNRIIPDSIPQRVAVIPQENHGQSHARNTGFVHSVGEYIAYLDVDDEWKSNHLSSKLCTLYNEKGDVVYGNFEYKFYMDNYDKAFIEHEPKKKYEYSNNIVGHEVALLKHSNFIAINTVMHSRRLFVYAGGFEEGVICGEDGVLWRRMAESGAHIVFDPNFTSYYCRYDKSIQVQHQSAVLRAPSSLKGVHLIGKGTNGQELDIQETYIKRVERLKKALKPEGIHYLKE